MAKSWPINQVPDIVNQIYQRVLERPVDPAGLVGYGCQLNRGEQSVKEIVRNIGHSQEYITNFIDGLVPNYDIVATRCYQHFLARAPDPGGLRDSIRLGISHGQGQAQLEQGFAEVIDSFIDSQEYASRFGDDTVPHP